MHNLKHMHMQTCQHVRNKAGRMSLALERIKKNHAMTDEGVTMTRACPGKLEMRRLVDSSAGKAPSMSRSRL